MSLLQLCHERVTTDREDEARVSLVHAPPEGHAIDYDESDAVIGMVLVNMRFLFERVGAVTLTIPPDRVVSAQLTPALVGA